MTMKGLRQLMYHGEAWCEEMYYRGLGFCEVLRGSLLEEDNPFFLSGSLSQCRQALVHLGTAVNTRGKRMRDRLRALSSRAFCHSIPKGDRP